MAIFIARLHKFDFLELLCTRYKAFMGVLRWFNIQIPVLKPLISLTVTVKSPVKGLNQYFLL